MRALWRIVHSSLNISFINNLSNKCLKMNTSQHLIHPPDHPATSFREVFMKEYDIPCSSDSDNDADESRNSARTRLDVVPDTSYVTFRNRASSKVSFTIGDSTSDCESVSTCSSTPAAQQRDSIGNGEVSPLNFKDETICCNDNKWHKHHFHFDDVDISSHEPNHVIQNSPVKLELTIVNEKMAGNQDEISDMSSGGVNPNLDCSVGKLSDVKETEDKSKISCFRRWGKWRVLIVCGVVQLFSALTISLQAPFYPNEAEKKGATATDYGFVFGIFELTVFIVAPLYGSKIHRWNPKFIFNIGIFTTAVASIIFGFLDKIDSRRYFIAACVVTRSLEAVGEAAVITASFIIVASTFPDSVAFTFAILETFYSVGLISGPIVGSILYEMGGYFLPFVVVGGSLVIAAILSLMILPSSDEILKFHSTEPIVLSSYKSFRLLKYAPVAVSAVGIVVSAISISYLQATLEPHLRQFNISQLSIGAIFIINNGVYIISAPFWGLICDKVVQLKLIAFCGAAIVFVGFGVIGPIPLLPFEPKVWIIALGLGVQGIGLGAVLVSSSVSILRSVINSGFPDSPSTYGLVSSLWTSMFSLGSFVGPSLSGILNDTVGFSWGTASVLVMLLILICISMIYTCVSTSELDSFLESETEPLIDSSYLSSSYSPPRDDSQPRRILTIRPGRYRRGNSYGSI